MSTRSPFTKPIRSSTDKVALFWLPHPEKLVVATHWHAYDKSPAATKGESFAKDRNQNAAALLDTAVHDTGSRSAHRLRQKKLQRLILLLSLAGIMAQSQSHNGADKPFLEDAKRQMDSAM